MYFVFIVCVGRALRLPQGWHVGCAGKVFVAREMQSCPEMRGGLELALSHESGGGSSAHGITSGLSVICPESARYAVVSVKAWLLQRRISCIAHDFGRVSHRVNHSANLCHVWVSAIMKRRGLPTLISRAPITLVRYSRRRKTTS